MRTWLDVARLTKTSSHGKGFVAHCAADLPFILKPGMNVRLVPPQIDQPRKAKVQKVEPISDEEANIVLVFEQPYENLLDLVGMHCLVRRNDIDVSSFEYPGALIYGYQVEDIVYGKLGYLVDVLDNGAQELLGVSLEEEGEAQILIPFVDEFITSIEPESKLIKVRVPEGILNLNAGL